MVEKVRGATWERTGLSLVRRIGRMQSLERPNHLVQILHQTQNVLHPGHLPSPGPRSRRRRLNWENLNCLSLAFGPSRGQHSSMKYSRSFPIHQSQLRVTRSTVELHSRHNTCVSLRYVHGSPTSTPSYRGFVRLMFRIPIAVPSGQEPWRLVHSRVARNIWKNLRAPQRQEGRYPRQSLGS